MSSEISQLKAIFLFLFILINSISCLYFQSFVYIFYNIEFQNVHFDVYTHYFLHFLNSAENFLLKKNKF